MPVAEILLSTLGLPVGKFLLKKYLELPEPADEIANELLKLAGKKITDPFEREDAEREFKQLASNVVRQLVPLFEGTSDEKAELICAEMQATLNGRLDAEFFLKRDLDPVLLTAGFKEARPLPLNQLDLSETLLYERVLTETVRYLVASAAMLPKFEQGFAAVSLQRLSAIHSDIREELRRVKHIEEMLAGGDETNRYEADYRQAVIRNLDKMELFGVQVPEEARSHSLSVAYVSLNLKGTDGGGIRRVEDVLYNLRGQNGRLLIRGAAGSGKSTLFRWIAIEAAKLRTAGGGVLDTPPGYSERLLEATKGMSAGDQIPEGHPAFELLREVSKPLTGLPWFRRVPFFLRLRQCSQGTLPTPDELPLLLSREDGNPPSGWVKTVLDKGEALVLLDGVDEVPKLSREQLKDGIEKLVKRYPKNVFLVSTRPAAVDENWLQAIGFREAEVEPLTQQDKTAFIENWHRAVEKEVKERGKPEAGLMTLASELVRRLPNSPANGMASTPLLCALICSMHYVNRGQLPANQVELFERTCVMLLHERERNTIPPIPIEDFPAAYRELSYAQKKVLVRAIAHRMVRNNESSAILLSDARREVVEELRTISYPANVPGLPESLDERADQVIEWLVERCGVLRETRQDELDFIHNSIKEYLAAEKFVAKNDYGVLAKNGDDPTWQPVVLFAAGLGEKEFTDNLIRRLLKPGTFRSGNRLQQIFAVLSGTMAKQIDSSLDAQLKALQNKSLAPRTAGEAELLAKVGNIMLPFLSFNPMQSADEQALCVRTLRLIGTKEALATVEGYLDVDIPLRKKLTLGTPDEREYHPLFIELAQTVNPLRVSAVKKFLVNDGYMPLDIRRHIDDLTPLAELTSVKSLNLSGTKISDVTPLSALTNLQILDLSGANVSDVTPLSALTNLQQLNLRHTKISDVTPLNALTNLQILNLRYIHTLNDVTPLSALTNLQILDLSGANVSDMTPLSALTNLQRLELSDTIVSDLTLLSALTNLQILDLSDTNVSDVTPLSALTNLQTLELIGTNVSDVTPLSALTNLQRLVLNKSMKRKVRGVELLGDKILWY